MCGIIGSFNLDSSPPKTSIVKSLLNTIYHRGPDAKNVECIDNVVFGNTRLSIIGINTEKANLPINDSSYMLAFNGEIYNYRELNKVLTQHNIRVEGKSDSETLFLYLKNFGIDRTLKEIDGMYVFAFYDKNNKVMHIARDKIGERFVYWTLSNKCLFFASEIKSIVKSNLYDVKPNIKRIDDYLYTGKVNGSETIFDNINELAPGTYLSIKKNQSFPKINKYWQIENSFNSGSDCFSQEKEFTNEFRNAIESRLISDVPVSFLFSGGIDSNALLSLFMELKNESNIDLFFSDNFINKYSELEDVLISIEFFKKLFPNNKLNLHSYKISYSEYMKQLEKVTWYYDEPIQFLNSILLSKLCSKIKNKNYKVCLSGEGSDELFYGYERFLRTYNKLGMSPSKKEKLESIYFGGGIHNVPIIKNLVSNSGVLGYESSEPWLWLEENINRDFNELQILHNQKYRLMMLLQRQDRIGMMHSIEIRTPYLAPKFVNYANNLLFSQKFDKSNNKSKVILKRSMKNRVADKIIDKQKVGYPSDMLDWINNDIRLKNTIVDTIQNSNSFSCSYLNGNIVNKILSDHFEGKKNLSTLVWHIFSLELWHKKFFL